jgi:hypothetical protein
MVEKSLAMQMFGCAFALGTAYDGGLVIRVFVIIDSRGGVAGEAAVEGSKGVTGTGKSDAEDRYASLAVMANI